MLKLYAFKSRLGVHTLAARAKCLSFALGAWIWPTRSWASDTPAQCVAPFDSSTCLTVFALLSVPYIVIASTYGVGLLVVMHGRFKRQGALPLGLLLSIPVSFVGVILGAQVGATLDWVHFAQDKSPFFFLDWFILVFVLLAQTALIGWVWHFGQKPEEVSAKTSTTH